VPPGLAHACHAQPAVFESAEKAHVTSGWVEATARLPLEVCIRSASDESCSGGKKIRWENG